MYNILFHPKFSENGFVYIGCNGSFDGKQRCRVIRYTSIPNRRTILSSTQPP